MDDILAVQIHETIQAARHDLAYLLFSQSVSVSDVAAQRSAVTVLHNDLVFTKWVDPHPELIVVTANIKVPDDILGGAFFQCFGCLLDLLGVRDDSGFLDSNKFIGRCIQC